MSDYYKNCFVPKCTNSTLKTPGKLFFHVPKGGTRKKWCTIARRDQTKSLSSNLFCCEDHFDLENDVEEWMRYKILKLSGAPTFNLRLKRNVVPHKFNCQTDRAVAHGSKPRTAIQKRDHLAILKTIPVESEINQPTPDVFENVLTTPDTPGHLLNPDPSDGVMVVDVEEVELLGTADKACQVQILKPQPPKPHVRSKAIQTDIISKTKPKKAVVPPSLTDYLSPEKNMVAPTEAVQDTSFHLSDIEENTSDSGSSDSIDAHLYLSYNIKLMLRKPRYYLGLDLENVKLIDHLSKFGKLKQNSVLLVLRKIRLNEPFHALADLFSSTKSVISRDFNSSLPRIFPLLEVFIFWPSRASIRSNLPLQFQSNFSNVESIIDCFEIQIEKPSKPTLQAITWSNYKTCNTLKFLVSCTPSGLINFISKGYSGRLTDMYIVEDCGYLEKLSAGSVVLADRGFKQLETLLHKKQCSLKRPPSVSAGVKLTKDQVKETKKIASLRVHVERVIKRLREYKFLDAHSRFHHNLLKNIDAVVIIAAALSNCQTPIISES